MKCEIEWLKIKEREPIEEQIVMIVYGDTIEIRKYETRKYEDDEYDEDEVNYPDYLEEKGFSNLEDERDFIESCYVKYWALLPDIPI